MRRLIRTLQFGVDILKGIPLSEKSKFVKSETVETITTLIVKK
jgi:hypothetical protein